MACFLRPRATLAAPAVVALTLTLTVVLAATAAPTATAAPGVQYGLTDDAWLQSGPGTVATRIATLQALGVQVVRFTLDWNRIAQSQPAQPTDPGDGAYDWSAADPVLQGLHEAGITTLVQLNGAPAWANGGNPPNYAPLSGTTFAAFATAAATRYSWVKHWLIWNEPNQARWLRPTTPRTYTTRLLNPAYAAIHVVSAGALVAGGGTAPRGSTGGVSPVAWLIGMRAAHARLDAYAHNPYPLDPKRESPLKGGCARCSTITMATLGRLVGLVGRYFPQAHIWLSEYGYQTDPPDRALGVSYALQARYLGEGAYAAFRAPRVDMLIHFLYQDEPSLARFQSGLVTLDSKEKPAYAAFELPLAETTRRGNRTSLWGELRAPAAGTTARIEELVGTTWSTLTSVSADSGGFYRWQGVLRAGSRVRVHAGALVGAMLTIT